MSENGEWYVIPSGDHAGTWHMNGWALGARLGTPSGPRDDGWLGWGTCPRCSAMVLIPRGSIAISPQILAHEQWHHRTDYPHPEAGEEVQDR